MGILQSSLSGDVPVTHNNPLTKIFVTRETRAQMAFPRHDGERVHSEEVCCRANGSRRGTPRPDDSLLGIKNGIKIKCE